MGTSMAKEIEGLNKIAEQDAEKIENLEKEITDGNTRESALKAAIATLKQDGEKAGTKHGAEIADSVKKLETATASITELEGQAADSEKKLVAAKAQLANPAFADADASGGDAVPDGGQNDSNTATPCYDEFKALQKAGKSREATKYWNKNKEAIQEEMANMAAQG